MAARLRQSTGRLVTAPAWAKLRWSSERIWGRTGGTARMTVRRFRDTNHARASRRDSILRLF